MGLEVIEVAAIDQAPAVACVRERGKLTEAELDDA
jgi:hypothetical protein